MAVYNRIGGMNKVTLNGKPPKDRINLNETLSQKYIGNFKNNNEYAEGIAYSPKIDNYLFCMRINGWDIYTLDKENYLGEIICIKGLPYSSFYRISMFTRNNDIYLMLGIKIYMYDVETKNFTEVETSLPEDFNTVYFCACFYIKESDELIVIGKNFIGKYSFKNKISTVISKNFPDDDIARRSICVLKEDKLYFLGTNTTKKDVTIYDLKKSTITTYNDALPYPIQDDTYEGRSSTKAFVLDGKIYILRLNALNQDLYSAFVETENIKKWDKISRLDTRFAGFKTIMATKDDNTVFFLNMLREYSYEIKKAYVKE